MAAGSFLPETLLVLDNDSLTHWRNKRPYIEQEISAYVSRHKRPPSLTSVTVFEALHGIEASIVKASISEEQSEKYIGKIQSLADACFVLPFDRNAAAIAAYIFPRLSKAERNKHWKDVFIAATALAHGHGIATQNKSDFGLIADCLPPSHPLLRLAVWKP